MSELKNIIPIMRTDAYFRIMIAKKVVRNSFFEHYIPNEILKHFDLDKLVSISSTNVDENLRKKMPDEVLFYRENPERVYCIHIECQSRNDKNMDKRFAAYQLAITKNYEKAFPDDHRDIVFLPILLQASKNPYTGKRKIGSFFNEDGQLFHGKIIVVDLPCISYEDLDKVFAARFLLVPMKYMSNGDHTSTYLYILRNKELIEKELDDLELEEAAKNYVLTSLSDDDRIELLETCKQYEQNLEGNMQTWANTYANEYAKEYGKKRYDEGFGLGKRTGFDDGKRAGFDDGKRAGFDDGKRAAEREIKFSTLQSMVEDGVDIKAAVKYLRISQEDLAFYIDKLENLLKSK